MMQLFMLLLQVLAFFGPVFFAVISGFFSVGHLFGAVQAQSGFQTHGCDCAVDFCVYPDNDAFACFVNGTIDQLNTTDFEFCSNGTKAQDMTAPVFWPSGYTSDMVTANTSNCAELLFQNIYFAQWVLTDEVYNNSMIPLTWYEDCILWIGGGPGAANVEGQMGDRDIFQIGNVDLEGALMLGIVGFAANGSDDTMAVCGTLNDCPVIDSISGNLTGVSPPLTYCIGGEYLGAAWTWWGGQGGPSPYPEPSDVSSDTKLLTLDAIDLDSLDSSDSLDVELVGTQNSNPRFILECREDNLAHTYGYESLYQVCVDEHDTYCDAEGNVKTTYVSCYQRCWCPKNPYYKKCVKSHDNKKGGPKGPICPKDPAKGKTKFNYITEGAKGEL